SHIDRVTGEPLRRYEHPHPGSLIHVDVTKFGNIPDGGGHRYVGRLQGHANRRNSENITRGKNWQAKMGTAFVHTVIDDNSRVAYAEICSGLLTIQIRPPPPADTNSEEGHQAWCPKPGLVSADRRTATKDSPTARTTAAPRARSGDGR